MANSTIDDCSLPLNSVIDFPGNVIMKSSAIHPSWRAGCGNSRVASKAKSLTATQGNDKFYMDEFGPFVYTQSKASEHIQNIQTNIIVIL